MRTLVLVAVVLALQSPEPYPGQGQHQQPPDGWYCEHQNYSLTVPVAHACNCERMYDPDTCAVHEDRQCTVWCWPDHCHCGVTNKGACK